MARNLCFCPVQLSCYAGRFPVLGDLTLPVGFKDVLMDFPHSVQLPRTKLTRNGHADAAGKLWRPGAKERWLGLLKPDRPDTHQGGCVNATLGTVPRSLHIQASVRSWETNALLRCSQPTNTASHRRRRSRSI
ncbi:uncharacterized protein [Dermacentor albipictus]|uniref:uncharacterized protein n=1 Tax=Dermacentor albipictus TaxID=60249 RepID=UPI0038FC0024